MSACWRGAPPYVIRRDDPAACGRELRRQADSRAPPARSQTRFSRAQDAGLAATGDQDILAWAAREGRVLLTRDVRTMVQFAHERVSRGEPMPGVVVVLESVPLALAIEQIQMLAGASQVGEWEGRALYLPF